MWKIVLAWMLLLAGFVQNPAGAQPQNPPLYAIAHLAIARYGQVAAQAHPKQFGAVVFTNTFGDAKEEVRQLLDTGKVPFIEYNLLWSDTHSFSRRDFPFIVEEAKKYAKITNDYPNVQCAFSGATEHKLNRVEAQELADLVILVIPARCIYVNNPWVNFGAFLPPSEKIWNEVHGEDAQPPNVGGKYIFNYDGSDCFDSHATAIKKRHRNAQVFVFWTSQNNGRKNKNDKTPRPQRQAFPTPELITAMAFLATDQGNVNLPPKKQLPGARPSKIPRTRLVKPKADQHSVPKPERRALKPVFIVPENVPNLTLRVGNKVIITSSGPEEFVDGRKRYYFDEYGYEIVRQAKTNVLNLYAGNQKLGTVNPGFRQN